MKKKQVTVAMMLLGFAGAVFAADTSVSGYTKQNGTYVEPYQRTAPDSTRTNNYESRGNTNPYTGQEGTRDPYRQPTNNNPYGQAPKKSSY